MKKINKTVVATIAKRDSVLRTVSAVLLFFTLLFFWKEKGEMNLYEQILFWTFVVLSVVIALFTQRRMLRKKVWFYKKQRMYSKNEPPEEISNWYEFYPDSHL